MGLSKVSRADKEIKRGKSEFKSKSSDYRFLTFILHYLSLWRRRGKVVGSLGILVIDCFQFQEFLSMIH